MQTNIVSYTFRNRTVFSAPHTDRMQLNEIIVYLLCEQLMEGKQTEQEWKLNLLMYLDSILDVLDRPLSGVIYNEIVNHVDTLSSDLVYQSLLVNEEFYLKYDYHLGKNSTRIQLYVDPSESAWMHW